MDASQGSSLIVSGKDLPAPNLNIRNYRDHEVHQFTGRARGDYPTNEVIIHETVTRSAASTVAVLERRGLSVHLIVDPDGLVTQHGDLAARRYTHAGTRHNRVSVGIEVVNPYYPHLLRDGLPWTDTIPARWAHKDAYVLPTPAQAEATAQLIAWLTEPGLPGIDIPRTWIGVREHKLRMGRLPEQPSRREGIWAHHYFGHADGAWLVLYAWLRIEARLDPEAAFTHARRFGEETRREVDLSQYFFPV